jgi:hypothetical protein
VSLEIVKVRCRDAPLNAEAGEVVEKGKFGVEQIDISPEEGFILFRMMDGTTRATSSANVIDMRVAPQIKVKARAKKKAKKK